MEDNTLYMSMLFDFFGDLLTDKQREYFDLYYNEDLSLSEIAAGAGISRQGVYDIITRAEKSLEAFEEKTGVVARFDEMRQGLDSVLALSRRISESLPDGAAKTLAACLEAELYKINAYYSGSAD